ncbi:hypothetical protein [Amphibacillus jilinensis]|uniref:hypothetical protein n=1 Tax=Amphibacillus jilinensis TaxID=1216008 RepID=UPI00037B8F71|nr:hypothetical protein [Amphibacillus jilinensis]
MVDAFVYMFVVGAGTSLGVAVIAFLSWKIVQKSNAKHTKKRGGKLNGIVK